MWLWSLIGLSIITKVHGYSSGDFTESCESMLPNHPRRGVNIPPQSGAPPFYIEVEEVVHGQPLTVSLKSNAAGFKGFMLEAREKNMVGKSCRVGKFILLDSSQTKFLLCTLTGCQRSEAVTQTTNSVKDVIKVNWTAQGEEVDTITFRATFLQSYSKFWKPVEKNVSLPLTTTSPPPTTTTTTTTTTTQSSTTTSTTVPSTTNPSSTTSTTVTSTKNPRSTTPTPRKHPDDPTVASTTACTTAPSTTNPSSTISTTVPSATNPSSTTSTTVPSATNPSTKTSSTVPSTTNPSSTTSTTVPSTKNPSSTTSSTVPNTTNPSSTTVPSTTNPSSTISTTVRSVINTANPSNTTSTTVSSTTSTAKAHTTTSTTVTNTTSTTKPSTKTSSAVQSVTNPSSTTSTTVPSATSTAKSSTAEWSMTNLSRNTKLLIVVPLMDIDLFIDRVKQESDIIYKATRTDNHFSRCGIKALKILCCVLCTAIKISVLFLLREDDYIGVTLTALVCVALVISIIDLVINCLPIEASHELKDIFDYADQVCSVIHMVFSFAAVFVGVLKIEDLRKKRKDSWLVKVMIAYTVLIFLSANRTNVFNCYENAILGTNKTGASKRSGRKKNAGQVCVIAVSVILFVGTLCFTVAVIVGEWEKQEK